MISIWLPLPFGKVGMRPTSIFLLKDEKVEVQSLMLLNFDSLIAIKLSNMLLGIQSIKN